MRQNSANFVVFVLLAGLVTFVWWYADKNWVRKNPPAETSDSDPNQGDDKKKDPDKDKATDPPKKDPPAAAEPKPAPKSEAKDPTPAVSPAVPQKPARLVRMGGEGFYKRVLLNSRGAGVQQVVLTQFEDGTRIGKAARDANGNTVPLYLIPGVEQPHGPSMRSNPPIPDIAAGAAPDANNPDNPPERKLVEPSYLLFHYPIVDDKVGSTPDTLLGTSIIWERAQDEKPLGDEPLVLPDGTHVVTFETEALAGSPYYLKLRKTFTLGPKDYHIGFRLDIIALAERKKGKGAFRYQISGPRGLPVEGEWYTSTPRACMIGWVNNKGAAERWYEEAGNIVVKRGGEKRERAGGTFKYAAIATQYFASALAIDDTAPEGARNPWEYVRATSEHPLGESDIHSDRAPYVDISFRAVSDPLDLGPNETKSFSFVIYNGPAKVRLLKQLQGDRAVDPALVDRYHDRLGLYTITDYRSDTWLGRFANAIYWTDLVIVFTNLTHWLLFIIHTGVGSWGLSIILLTVLVRLILFLPSKKQTQMNLRMMEIQKKLQPELEKLHEKYKDDFHGYQREKTRLMLAHGLNPLAAMGGCLLLFAQMPIMLGLYFGLQESIFFRLQDFLWVDNLAAPDMTLWWSEEIPWLSRPQDLGGFLYLGPYLNILPLLAVGLMIWQQNKMMPPPTDEQMAAQQRMMKFMMIIVAIMFFKVAAGLALYFIVGTVWGLIERKFIPKAVEPAPGTNEQSANEPAKPKGFFGRLRERLRQKMEELQKQAEEQASRQHKNKPQDPNAQQPIRNPEQPNRPDRDRKRKRKK